MSPGDMINDKRTLRVWFFMNHPLLQRLKLKINDFLKKIQETFEILFNISLFLAQIFTQHPPRSHFVCCCYVCP